MRTIGELEYINSVLQERLDTEIERGNKLACDLDDAKAEIEKLSRQNKNLLLEQEHEEQVRKELQQRADRAEAACAEMRHEFNELIGMACEFIGPDEDGNPQCVCCGMCLESVSKGHKQDCLAQAILDRSNTFSSPCGHGFLSPAARQQAVEALQRILSGWTPQDIKELVKVEQGRAVGEFSAGDALACAATLAALEGGAK